MENENIVQKIRVKFNISQEELAHVLGVSYTSVNAWEGGKRTPQDHMMNILTDILESDQLPILGIDLKTPKGLFRTDAGYVSSVINYDNVRDFLPYTHNIGRWYGSLPSFLVRDLLQFARTDFNNHGPVLANFSGSGTVALEAGLAGMECYASDINPMALQLSRVKTTPLHISSKEFKEAYQSIINNQNIIIEEDSLEKSNLFCGKNKWIPDELKRAVLQLSSGIMKISDEGLKNLFSTALASIVINFANIDKRCTNHYVYKESAPFNREQFNSAFLSEAETYLRAIGELENVANYKIPSVLYGSCCSLPFEDNSMGIVFSHPPYGTTINYYSINRIQMSILDLINLKTNSKSTIIEKCRENDISSGTLSKFCSFTSAWVNEAFRVLRPGGLFISIIGDSRDGGKLSHPFTDIISYGEQCGFVMKELFIWVTNHKSGMHIKRKGNHIDHNYIIIMEKK